MFVIVNICAFVSVSCGVIAQMCIIVDMCMFVSVNWCVGDLALEVVNPMTGRTEQDSTSRVSKQSLFQLYTQTASLLKPLADRDQPATPKLYVDAKALFVEYLAAKEELFKTFHKTGLGNWVKKPAEVDQFEVTDMAA